MGDLDDKMQNKECIANTSLAKSQGAWIVNMKAVAAEQTTKLMFMAGLHQVRIYSGRNF